MADEKYRIIILVSPKIEAKLQSQYETCRVKFEQELISKLCMFSYDLIIVENLVGCKRMNQLIWNIRDFCNIPIIVLADRTDKRELIYAGADAVLEKDSSIDELQVEIFALMRRWKNRQKTRYKLINISIGKLFFNIDEYDVYWDRKKIGLSRLEFDFFYFLALSPGRVYTFEQLYQTVWKQFPIGNVQNVLWCLVRRIRKKMNKIEKKAGRCIVNIRGIGYCFRSKYAEENTNSKLTKNIGREYNKSVEKIVE